MANIFLSASIPLPTRNPKYHETVDVILLREAIKALAEAVLPHGRITFGGHPAITPMIVHYIRAASLPKRNVTLFQSAFFLKDFPKENEEFLDLRVTPAEVSRDRSLALMRNEMINSADFDAAVLIGGMEGVVDEAALFRELHPRKPVFPVASTGAGAAEVFSSSEYPQELVEDLTYTTLFRRLLIEGQPQ